MWTFSDLIKNFFTHKDFLPSADKIPGTLFTPLHFIFSAISIAAVIFLALYLSKKSEEQIKRVFAVIWVFIVAFEIAKITWDVLAGEKIDFEWGGSLPLYPCSIFMYAMPFAIWGKGLVRRAACGYVCTLGLLGGTINFVYPATVLCDYSCISFHGFHTFIYHGVLVLCAFVMIRSGYYKFTGITKWWELVLPSAPLFAVSIIANIVNFSAIQSDYMFFKLNSFIFAPIGAATPDWVAVIIVYIAYIIVHGVPHLPSYIANLKRAKEGKAESR